MTTYGRRRQLLALVYEHPGIGVPELALRLGVSQGTIRNDLTALAKLGELQRVHGGAVPTRNRQALAPLTSPAASRRPSPETANPIVRWASALVEDGDAIALDSSLNSQQIALSLASRRNLTIVTNRLDAARILGAGNGHTVILLGGVLDGDCTSVTGSMDRWLPLDLHIGRAFISCAGYTPEAGLTEMDLRQAEVKRWMIDHASQLVVMVESNGFGRVGPAPVAQLSQVSHFLTDDQAPPSWVERLQRSVQTVSLCGESQVVRLSGSHNRSGHYRIGFANLNERLSYAADVRHSLERAAQAAGSIDLIEADNRMSNEVALQVADRLIAERVDLLVEYQLDYALGEVIMARCQEAGIPVIAVDIPMIGATFFGVDNYHAGHMAGVALGHWIEDHWRRCYDQLVTLERSRAGALPAARMRGLLAGIEGVLGAVPAEKVVHLDCGEDQAANQERVERLLTSLSRSRVAILAFSDSLALAAVAAVRALGKQSDTAVVSQGGDRETREEMARPDSPLIGATAFYPERYGDQIIALALKILRGEVAPPALYIEHAFMTRESCARKPREEEAWTSVW